MMLIRAFVVLLGSFLSLPSQGGLPLTPVEAVASPVSSIASTIAARVRAGSSDVASNTASNPASNNPSLLSNKTVVVAGAGPVGLYFAALLLQADPTVRIEILERDLKRDGRASSNAYGLGVGQRMKNRLNDVPGLYEKATSVSTIVDGFNIPLVSRDDLVNNMRDFLEDRYGKKNCRISFGEQVSKIDFQRNRVQTASGRTLKYDLLVGADGVHSQVRRLLVDDATINAQLGEEHYTEDAYWKALQLPAQTHLGKGSFKPLRHPSIEGGRVLPKAPKGHFLLLYWKSDQHDFENHKNPKGIVTKENWKEILNTSVNDDTTPVWKIALRKLMGFEVGDTQQEETTELIFDERLLTDFTNSKAKSSHHLRLEKYHCKNVALIGDSAHAFSSLLGQGCATGLECTKTLVDYLLQNKGDDNTSASITIDQALEDYTRKATMQAHAMTEIALIQYALRGGINLMTLKAMPLVIWNMARGKGLLKRLRDIHVPFTTIAKENQRLLKLCRTQFEKERKPFVMKRR